MSMPLRAELRDWYSHVELESYVPPDPRCFALLLDVLVGAVGMEGGEQFSLVVCTPSWFEQQMAGAPASGAYHVFVSHYDWDAILGFVRRSIEGCRAETWEGLVHKVSRYGRSEFENGLEPRGL